MSACGQSNRLDGGAMALTEPFGDPVLTVGLPQGDIVLEENHPVMRFSRLGGATRAKMGSIPELLHYANDWRDRNYSEFVRIYDNARNEYRARDLDRGYYEHAMLRSVAIPEPGGKARIVTIGDGYLYSILQPLQGNLIDNWKVRSESTMFVPDLTEKVQLMYDLTQELSLQLCQDTSHVCEDFDGESEWVNSMRDLEITDLPIFRSGDYSAATDLVKQACTFAVLDGIEMGKGVPAAELELARDSFLPGVLTNAKFEKDNQDVHADGSPWVRIDGQPMGHPLSFPILCCTNLGVFHCALLRWIKMASGKEAARRMMWSSVLKKTVIVNGDDIAFRAPLSFMSVFDATAADAGFEISIGKDYSSPTHLLINSQLFVCRRSVVQRVGYLNQNLFNGSVKKTSSTKGPCDPLALAQAVNKTLSLYPAAKVALPRLMRRASESFLGSRFTPNWFLPVEVGGMGILPQFGPRRRHEVPGWYKTLPSNITRDQRMVAAAFLADPSLRLYRRAESYKDETEAHMDALLQAMEKLTARVQQIRKDDCRVPTEFEFEGAYRDTWSERAMMIRRAMSKGQDQVSEELVFRRIRVAHRLHPVSLSRLEEAWEVRYVATEAAIAPPLCSLPTW